MFRAVVVWAQAVQVRFAGAPVGPGDAVVGVGLARGPVAQRERAVLVAGLDEPPEPLGDPVAAGAEVPLMTLI